MTGKLTTTLRRQIFSLETTLSFMCFFLLVWVFFIATPFEIITANMKEFTHTPVKSLLANGFSHVVIYLSLLIVIYIFISNFISNSTRRYLLCVLATLAISVWLNSTFFVGSYGEIDGATKLNISPYGLLNSIQAGASISIFLFFIAIRKNTKFLLNSVIFASVITLSATSINIASKLSEPTIGEASESDHFQYSSNNNNLLFIILDEYQVDYFENILTDRLKMELDSFIWFKDAMSIFPTTSASLPSMLTTELYSYDKDMSLIEFYSSVSDQSIANKFGKHGANVTFSSLYANTELLFPPDSLVNFTIKDEEYISTYTDLLNLSLFRAVPDMIKQHTKDKGKYFFVFNNDELYHIKNGIGRYVSPLHYFSNANFKSAVGPTAFNYHHSFLTHSPTSVGRDCTYVKNTSAAYSDWKYQDIKGRSEEGECAVRLVLDVIHKLKEIDVFDNTMIIVTADHGSWHDPEQFLSNPNVYSRASPTLLIKPLYSKERFLTSEYPATLSDIPKTIAESFNMENTYPGVNLLGGNNSLDRERAYNDYLGRLWRVTPMNKYIVKGPLRDPDSWSGSNFQIIRKCGSPIVFSNKDQLEHYKSTGLGAVRKHGRWTEGKISNIDFTTSKNCDAKFINLKLNAFVTSKHPEQTGHVFINEEHVGDIRIVEGEERPRIFTLPLPYSKSNTYSLRIEVDNPVQPKSLGIGENISYLGFAVISLEPSLDGEVE